MASMRNNFFKMERAPEARKAPGNAGHTGTSGAWNNWIGLNQYVNTPLEDVIGKMSFEETMSCILRFLAQDAQYMDSLQQPQGTEAHGKGFLENSNPTQRSGPVMQKQPAASWDQNPEQSNRNHREEESQRAQSGQDGGAGKEGEEEAERAEKEQEELEKDEKRENKAPGPTSRFVSKSLMTSLWERFKVNKHPTVQDVLSLSFQFNMTDKQIIKWFCEKRKKYKEMTKQKHIKKLKR
nr:NANOG neighbor homeobox [Oryctolagus cuniculus]